MIGVILNIFFILGIKTVLTSPSLTFNIDRERGVNVDIDPIPKYPFLLMGIKDQDNINNADFRNINGRQYSYSYTIPCPVDYVAQNTLPPPTYALNRDSRKPLLDVYDYAVANDLLYMQPSYRNQLLPRLLGLPGKMAESLLRQLGM